MKETVKAVQLVVQMAKELKEAKAKIKLLEQQMRELRENAIIWGVEDFFSRAEDVGYIITEDQAAMALDDMMQHHDANNGICWDTVDYYLTQYGVRMPEK